MLHFEHCPRLLFSLPSLPFPLPLLPYFHFPSFPSHPVPFPPILSLILEVGPLNPARGPGGAM